MIGYNSVCSARYFHPCRCRLTQAQASGMLGLSEPSWRLRSWGTYISSQILYCVRIRDLERARTLHHDICKAFRHGLIIRDAKTAKICSSYRSNSSLHLALSITEPKGPARHARQFLKPFQEVPSGSTIILVSIGLDGLSCDEQSLINFFRYFHDEQGIRIRILVAEHSSQWQSKSWRDVSKVE